MNAIISVISFIIVMFLAAVLMGVAVPASVIALPLILLILSIAV